MSKADQSCLGSGAPNYLAVLAKFYAKQMAETNTRTTKVKHALARWDTDKQTIPFQKRTSGDSSLLTQPLTPQARTSRSTAG